MKAALAALLGLQMLLSGACTASGNAPTAPDTQWIPSRNQLIPVTLTTPKKQSTPVPLVLLIHGHGGTRHEAGGFTRVAHALAAKGIASVRMDFPGCGDSTESFVQNNLSNMRADVAAAQRYAMAEANIDPARMGLLGFSMGGRIAISMAHQGFVAMALWAPSAKDGAGAIRRYLGGAEAYARAKERARQEGYAPFTTFWGQQQKLGYQWFTDLEASRPQAALAQYPGALFVLYGDEDPVILPAASRQVLTTATAARSTEVQVLPGADHGLGLFNDDWASSELAVQSTVGFLARELAR